MLPRSAVTKGFNSLALVHVPGPFSRKTKTKPLFRFSMYYRVRMKQDNDRPYLQLAPGWKAE